MEKYVKVNDVMKILCDNCERINDCTKDDCYERNSINKLSYIERQEERRNALVFTETEMPRYINADRFNKFDYSKFDGQLTEDAIQGMDTVLMDIDVAPTEDVVEVRYAKWESIQKNDYRDNCYRCSLCMCYNDMRTNYCPHCGAKMNNEKE